MYCPKCGDELIRTDMRCEGCGTDLRRIIREEYWAELAKPEERPQFSDRFDHAGESAVNESSWRNLHRADDKKLYIIGGGSVLVAIIIMVLFLAFSSRGKDGAQTSDDPASSSATTNQTNTATPPPPPPPAPIEQAEAEAFIENWRKSWELVSELKKAADFIALYSEDFVAKPSGKDKKTFLEERVKAAKASTVIFVEILPPAIQLEKDKVIATFSMNFLSDKKCEAGTETLVIARRNGKLAIIEESYTDLTPVSSVDGEKLKETILDWRKAWEELAIKHELGALPTFYSPDFKGPKGRDSATVLNQKLELAKKNSIITIEVKDVNVSILGDRAVASFRQVFMSKTYSDDGVKILVFKLRDGVPLITWEGFRLNKKLPGLDADDFWGQ